ncbi:MAG: hypothetical protein K2K91_06525 [Ruminococcus sp.]|nr:hypothetical protein [Ruminococcus sp.]
MSYTTIKNKIKSINYPETSLEGSVLKFIRECCENMRFSEEKTKTEEEENRFCGASIKESQIPYNMQMDIEKLCLENALERFLKSGKKKDAFDVYFCYLEMFIGNYGDVRRVIELLSEFEANASGLLMKHRDHYSHSVYVFALGLAFYYNSSAFRKVYSEYYGLSAEKSACHYLEYWGLASLFHDIGYLFELPFEEVCSYFEVQNMKREYCPHISYRRLTDFISISDAVSDKIRAIYPARHFKTINELFAYILIEKLGKVYSLDENEMLSCLSKKPTEPNEFENYIDHAYFSAVALFKMLFDRTDFEVKNEHLDALTAVLMHNSLYKFNIARYKSDDNKPFNMNLHPLAYMLMLCDELQCWDRIAYGRNSKLELHPMDCRFELHDNSIEADYIYDEKEYAKIKRFEDEYEEYLKRKFKEENKEKAPELKAYSKMYIKDSDGISCFLSDIRKIVNLNDINLEVKFSESKKVHEGTKNYLSNSNFLSLYNFAVVLNGRWNGKEWKNFSDKDTIEKLTESFNKLSLEYKLSNINQAKAFAGYMNMIDCFYTDRQVDFEMVEDFSGDELKKIGIAEHKRWLTEHYNMGWEYGLPENAEREIKRQHMDLIPGFSAEQGTVTDEMAEKNYKRLNKEEQDKDTEPMKCMLAMLRMFDGLRIYRLKS